MSKKTDNLKKQLANLSADELKEVLQEVKPDLSNKEVIDQLKTMEKTQVQKIFENVIGTHKVNDKKVAVTMTEGASQLIDATSKGSNRDARYDQCIRKIRD